MLAIDFQMDKVSLTKAALGGAVTIDLSYKKFPGLANVPISELEQLGAALGVAVANLDYRVAHMALEAAAQVARDIQNGPGIIVPDKQLVMPA